MKEKSIPRRIPPRCVFCGDVTLSWEEVMGWVRGKRWLSRYEDHTGTCGFLKNRKTKARICHDCCRTIIETFFQEYNSEIEDIRTEYLPKKAPKEKAAAATNIPIAVRIRVFRRCDFKCVTCKTEENLTIDHIVPRSKGGTHDETNLQALCNPCNGKKGNRV